MQPDSESDEVPFRSLVGARPARTRQKGMVRDLVQIKINVDVAPVGKDFLAPSFALLFGDRLDSDEPTLLYTCLKRTDADSRGFSSELVKLGLAV